MKTHEPCDKRVVVLLSSPPPRALVGVLGEMGRVGRPRSTRVNRGTTDNSVHSDRTTT